MDNFNSQFGDRLSMLRNQRGLTREQLSEKAQISSRFIYDIESGKKSCSAEILLALSRALVVTADYLLTGRQPQTDEQLQESLQMLSSVDAEALPHINAIIKSFSEYAHKKI